MNAAERGVEQEDEPRQGRDDGAEDPSAAAVLAPGRTGGADRSDDSSQQEQGAGELGEQDDGCEWGDDQHHAAKD